MEVPVEVYRELPKTLIEPLTYPAVALEGNITMGLLVDLVFELYDLLDVANSDRATAAELTQPSPADAPQ